MLPRFAPVLILLAVLLAVTAQPGYTQTDQAVCPAVVEQALTQVGDNCAGLERNSACYGFTRVDTTFSAAVPADFFTHPAERAALTVLESIQTTPLDVTAGQWGIAVMKAQANVPDTLPGQAVTFLLMGDTEVRNAVSAAASGQGIAVIAQASTSALAEPRADANRITPIPAGTVLDADELSADGGWLRVRLASGVGWVPRAAVNPIPAIESLPVSGAPRLTPMQAFYFRNGPGQTTCAQAPSALAIHSPEGITVDLSVNGVHIRLGSLVILRTVNGQMHLTTVYGLATLNPDMPDELPVPAGFSTTRCLAQPDDDSGDSIPGVGDDCPWSEPQPFDNGGENEDEDQPGGGDDAVLEGIHTVLDAFSRLGIDTGIEDDEAQGCAVGEDLLHTVQPGENLLRIAIRYGTTVQAIVAANALRDVSLIVAGQQLLIPCAVDSGLPSRPPTPAPGEAAVTADCSRFAPVSPVDGLRYGTATFYWNAALGASAYRLNIYSVDERSGAQVASFTTTSTNLTVDTTIATFGYGFQFAWDVQALGPNGEVLCASSRVNLPRAAQPGGPPAPPPPDDSGDHNQPPPPTEEPPPPPEQPPPPEEPREPDPPTA